MGSGWSDKKWEMKEGVVSAFPSHNNHSERWPESHGGATLLSLGRRETHLVVRITQPFVGRFLHGF